MAYKTLSALAEDVGYELSLVPGTSVQLYADEIIKRRLKDEFYVLAREPSFWWPQFMTWLTRTLDGTTGRTTVGLTGIQQHDDIRAIFIGTNSNPMPELRRDTNPNTYAFNQAVYEFDNDALMLKVYPITTTGSLYIHGRVLPTTIVNADVMQFDDVVLKWRVCYKMSETDAANAGQTSMFQGEFERAMQRLKARYSQMNMQLDRRSGVFPNEWQEMP
jgi:hypothetical protein